MEPELALKCTGMSNCKWHGAIVTPQDTFLSDEERLRQPLASQAVAQQVLSQLGDLKAPPGFSAGGLKHMPPVRVHLPHQALPAKPTKNLKAGGPAPQRDSSPQHCTTQSPAATNLVCSAIMQATKAGEDK